MNLRIYLLLHLWVCCLIRVNAQNNSFEASDARITKSGDQIIITYDLPEAEEGKYTDVEVYVLDYATNRKTQVPEGTGDVGFLKPGTGKTIKWTFAPSGATFSDTLGVRIVASTPFKAAGGPANAFRSLIIPGWGNYYVRTGKETNGILITVGTIGLLGTGAILELQSQEAYESYNRVTDQKRIDKFYNEANQKHHAAYYFLIAGSAVWVSNVAYVAIKGASNKRKNNNIKSSTAMRLHLAPMATGVSLRLTF